MPSTYDTIGVNYSDLRKPDPRIGAAIEQALGAGTTLLNVGAGTGSYEPEDWHVTAIEPSAEMIRQRTTLSTHVVQGFAEELPFADKSFDASMAILTIHHWKGKEKGLKEMRRVSRGPVVVLTFDPWYSGHSGQSGYWLADYFPELFELDKEQMPKMRDFEQWLGRVDISPVPVPHDCIDGFLCAYWRRPAAYLDPKIRAAMSSFWAVGTEPPELKKLADDLESGVWARRHAGLLTRESYDVGYRLVVAP